MTHEFHRRREVKAARKDRRCHECRVLIAAGNPYTYCSGYSEDFYAYGLCHPCLESLDEERERDIEADTKRVRESYVDVRTEAAIYSKAMDEHRSKIREEEGMFWLPAKEKLPIIFPNTRINPPIFMPWRLY